MIGTIGMGIASGTSTRLVSVLAGVAAGCLAGAGCAGTHGSSTTRGAAGSGGAGTSEDGGVIFAHYDGPPPSFDGASDAPMRVVGSAPLGDAACAAQTQKAERLPLDMYVMLDSSGSMTALTASRPRRRSGRPSATRSRRSSAIRARAASVSACSTSRSRRPACRQSARTTRRAARTGPATSSRAARSSTRSATRTPTAPRA